MALTTSLDDLRLETTRLILRVPRATDLDPWSEFMTDQEACRYIGGTMPRAMTWRAA